MEVEKLKVWRAKRDLNQSQLAKKAGINQSIVSLIESGNRKRFDKETTKAVATALEVEVEQIEEFAKFLTELAGKTGRHPVLNQMAVATV